MIKSGHVVIYKGVECKVVKVMLNSIVIIHNGNEIKVSYDRVKEL